MQQIFPLSKRSKTLSSIATVYLKNVVSKYPLKHMGVTTDWLNRKKSTRELIEQTKQKLEKNNISSGHMNLLATPKEGSTPADQDSLGISIVFTLLKGIHKHLLLIDMKLLAVNSHQCY